MTNNGAFGYHDGEHEHLFENTDEGFAAFLDSMEADLEPIMAPAQVAFAKTLTATMRRVAAHHDEDQLGGEVESSCDEESEFFSVKVWKHTAYGRIIIFGFDLPFRQAMEYMMNWEVPT